MKRFVLLIAAAGLFVSAAVSDAAPRRWGAYSDYYGYGYVEPWGTGYYYGSIPYYYSSTPYYSNAYYSSTPYSSNGMYYSSTQPMFGSTGPWTSGDWYKNAMMTSRGTADSQGGVVQASNYEPVGQPTSAHYGLLIDDVVAGGAAKKADLRKGDVIIGVGTTRTQSFEDLQKALASNTGNLEVVFLNAENRKMEKAKVTPVDGKIGVAVVPITLR